MQSKFSVLLLLWTVHLFSNNAVAHDLWLVPSESSLPGDRCQIRANSGMDFPDSEHAPDPDKFSRRFLFAPDGSEGQLEARGKDGNSGLLQWDAAEPGIYVLAVQTEPKLITLEADDFNHYLVADGLPHIYQLRRKEGSLNKSARERYSKSPKALLQVGSAGAGDPCRIVGLPLEIVPCRDPFSLAVGDTLRVCVLFRDQPLADANLGWDLPHDGEAPSGTVRTDSRGEALVPISRLGLMTIRLTHMTRPKENEFEWESFWTTLTFRIPEPHGGASK